MARQSQRKRVNAHAYLVVAATAIAVLAVPAVSVAASGQTKKMTGNDLGYVDGTTGFVSSVNETQHSQFDAVTLHLGSRLRSRSGFPRGCGGGGGADPDAWVCRAGGRGGSSNEQPVERFGIGNGAQVALCRLLVLVRVLRGDRRVRPLRACRSTPFCDLCCPISSGLNFGDSPPASTARSMTRSTNPRTTCSNIV